MKQRKQRQEKNRRQAETIAAHLKASEYALIEAVTAAPGLSLKAAGKLVALQRRLRLLRYEIEAEARIW